MHKGVPQTMDITSIKAVLHHLSNEILPSKFEIAQQPEPNTIQIGFRAINNTSWIEVSWQGDCARIIRINKPDKLGSTSTLARQLSCGLRYMALVSIKQDNFERVIKLEFAKKPGDPISKFLIFEIMGKHSNIFYLDRNYKIIAAGKQIKSSQSSFRTISTGNFYTPPPSNFKKEPTEKETYTQWKENLSSIPEPLKDALLNTYQGVSPILIKQIEYITKSEEKGLMNKNLFLIDEKLLEEIFFAWRKWIHCFNNNKFNFTLFNNYFYCVWFSESDKNNSMNNKLFEGISNYYDYYLKLNKVERLVKRIDSLIYKQANIEKKNLNIQSKLLINSENHDEYKEKADSIFSKINLQKKDVVEAQKLYKKSKKLKRAKNLIKDRLYIYSEKLARLDEFSAMLDNLNLINIGTIKIKINLLEELKEELCNEFCINKIKTSNNKSSDNKSLPIEINSPEGIIIQIGRNMRQNDLISFKFSKKQDLWFHAQESPGSHVILKASSKLPSEIDIQTAADIAAFFCRAKGNIKVPINLVKVKDLQRINKAGLGCVSFKSSGIIWGNPTRGKDYIKSNSQK